MVKKQTQKSLPIHRKLHRHVKMAIVPHADNQFKPHLIRRSGIAILLVLVIGLQFGYNWSKTGTVLGVEANITTDQLLGDTNKERLQGGVQPLSYSDSLSNAAFMKAQDMLKKQYWAHVAPDGTTPWAWLSKVNYNYSYAGENLAKNFASADAAMTAWMNSPKHKENIISPNYSQVGFAVVDGTLGNKPTKLIVALYGHPATTEGVAGATTAAQIGSPGNMNLVTRFGVALQSVTPAALGSVTLLLFAGAVALAAHAYRRQLPVAVRRTWHYHHGLYKAVGLTAVAITFVTLYSGGQI